MKGRDGVQTEQELCYRLPSREVWVIQTGNERENGCKKSSAHDSSRDLALTAECPGARQSASSDLDRILVHFNLDMLKDICCVKSQRCAFSKLHLINPFVIH